MSIASWMACANVSWRLVINATDQANMCEPSSVRCGTARFRERDRVVDVSGDLGVDLGMRGLVEQAMIFQQLSCSGSDNA